MCILIFYTNYVETDLSLMVLLPGSLLHLFVKIVGLFNTLCLIYMYTSSGGYRGRAVGGVRPPPF